MKALILLLLLYAASAVAGGSSFKCKIEGFEEASPGKYLLVARPLEQLDIKLPRTKDGLFFFHIEHSESPTLPSGNQAVSRAEFLAAIEKLKAASTVGVPTRFGYMGAAYRYIDRQPGHYRVFGLRIDEELTPDHKGTQRTVYAY